MFYDVSFVLSYLLVSAYDAGKLVHYCVLSNLLVSAYDAGKLVHNCADSLVLSILDSTQG